MNNGSFRAGTIEQRLFPAGTDKQQLFPEGTDEQRLFPAGTDKQRLFPAGTDEQWLFPDRIDEKRSFHRYHGPSSILMQIRMQVIKFSKKSPYEELKKTKKNVEKKKKQI